MFHGMFPADLKRVVRRGGGSNIEARCRPLSKDETQTGEGHSHAVTCDLENNIMSVSYCSISKKLKFDRVFALFSSSKQEEFGAQNEGGNIFEF